MYLHQIIILCLPIDGVNAEHVEVFNYSIIKILSHRRVGANKALNRASTGSVRQTLNKDYIANIFVQVVSKENTYVKITQNKKALLQIFVAGPISIHLYMPIKRLLQHTGPCGAVAFAQNPYILQTSSSDQ